MTDLVRFIDLLCLMAGFAFGFICGAAVAIMIYERTLKEPKR